MLWLIGFVIICNTFSHPAAGHNHNATQILPVNDSAPADNELLEQMQQLTGRNSSINIAVGRRSGRGRARTDYDCTPRSLPYAIRREMGLHRFYTKYAHAYGVPIISSNVVSDRAIRRACYVVRFALADRKDVRDWLYDRYGRAGIIGQRQRTTDIPEHSHLPNWWNQRARGLGATISGPISTAGEENILCYSNDRYYGGGKGEDIFLHEFAHAVHNLGVTGAIRDFDRRIRYLYNRRKRDGRWARTYFMSTDREFFAEGVTSYFDVNTETHDGRPNGIHNHVNTRQELYNHDKELYNLVKEVFPCGNKFLDRCSASRGARPPKFKMNCNKDGSGGKVVSTSRPNPTPRPTPPVPTKPSGGCIDKDARCGGWKGWCNRNQYVKDNCKKTCSKATDSHKHCAFWARPGKNYCSTNDFVKTNCKKSCGKC